VRRNVGKIPELEVLSFGFLKNCLTKIYEFNFK